MPIGAKGRRADHPRGGDGPAYKPSKAALWTQRIVAFVLFLVGLPLTAGGTVLAQQAAKSFYYVLTGLALAASSALIWRGDARGAWIYGAMLIGTVAWSVWEVGFSGWQLTPRLIAPFVLATMFLLPPIRKLEPRSSAPWRAWGWPIFAGGLVLAIMLGRIGHASAENLVRSSIDRWPDQKRCDR